MGTKDQSVCNEREIVQKDANYEMLSYNCMQRATTNARAGNLNKAQAIMKGFKRGVKKNITNLDQEAVYKDMNSQIGSVYAEMGEQIHELSDEEAEVLAKKPQAKVMTRSYMGVESSQPATKSIGASYKSKAPAQKSAFVGKQNDRLSSVLY